MTELRYHALPDPDDAGRMTYWRCDDSGRLREWPAKARYGPILTKAMVPASLDHEARRRWMLNWIETVSGPWHQQIRNTIDAEPQMTAARFADLKRCCAMCGRPLDEPTSRVYGVGPDCRDKLPPAMLPALLEAMRRAHAEAVRAA